VGCIKQAMKHIRTLVVLAIILFSLAFPILIGDPTTISMAVDVLLLMGAAVAWNIFSGYTGYISLGHATYYGLGAYVLALAFRDWHIPGDYAPFLLLPLAGLVAGAFAIPLGWIALRTSRYTFIVITIAIFFIFQLLAYNLHGLTNGSEGIFLPPPTWSPDLFNLPFYYVALALLLLVVGISWRIRCSKFGLVLLAIRDDEDRARGLGIRTGWYKLAAYVLSAAFFGMVGAIAIYFAGLINPPFAFDQTLDITVVTASMLGGVGTVLGPVVGGLVLGPIQTYLVQQYGSIATGFDKILFGGFLLVVLLLLPEGIVPSLRKWWYAWKTSSKTYTPKIPSFRFTNIPGVSRGYLGSIASQDISIQSIPVEQQPGQIAPDILALPGEQSVSLHMSMGLSQKVRAQRLVPISHDGSMSAQGQMAASPVTSWRCPHCKKPLLLTGNTCYCPRCGFTRPLTGGKQPLSPSSTFPSMT
jgi:branched-chain amino acid transport system permease protein